MLNKIIEQEDFTNDRKALRNFQKQILETDRRNTMDELEKIFLEYIQTHKEMTLETVNTLREFVEFIKVSY